MAILNAQQAVNTRDLPELEKIKDSNYNTTTQEGQSSNSPPNITQYRFDGIEVDLISNSGGFAGDLQYIPNFTYSGTVRKISVHDTEDVPYYSIDGFAFSLEDLFADAQDDKLDTIPAEIFEGDDTLNGSSFDDVLFGFLGADLIEGGNGDDEMNGGDGDDDLTGGLGADIQTGGDGADTFYFLSILESTKKASGRDTILDFDRAEGDEFHLTAIDAKKGNGNQDFKFIKKKDFGDNKGELRYKVKNGDAWVEGDTDGNGKADFVIVVADVTKLKAGDFEL